MTRLCIHCRHFAAPMTPTGMNEYGGLMYPPTIDGLCAHPDAPRSLVTGQPIGRASGQRDDAIQCGMAAHRFEERPE